MLQRCFNTILPVLTALLLAVGTAACGGDEPGAATHTHEGEEAHEHGEDTHTHEAVAADTAGTYVDTTGTFFEDEPEAAPDEEAHEHGEDTHTHE